ncbi:MAG: phosphoglucomutase/phosphomannomutase family protein [Bacillota bacterium]|nr:phosphoglucomutase/phosphomannomutase family protein [Bacillota bacterium]
MTIKFGTDGWRAIMAHQFTFSNVEIVVQAIANYLKTAEVPGEGIVIGYDNRFLSPEFAKKAAEIMLGNGIKVYFNQKAMPTPVTAFAVVAEKAKGALMFTASHNPPTYNGVKFIPYYGGPALPEVTSLIEEELQQVEAGGDINALLFEEGQASGAIIDIDPKEDYLQHLISLVDVEAIKAAGLKVAVDPMFGAGADYLDQLLARLNCNVKAIHNYRDPLFGGKMPEPSQEVLQELIELVKEPEIDLGLALDGDADRFGIIDRDGAYISANQVLALLLMHLLKKGLRGPVTKAVSTTQMLSRIANDYGLELLETPVGFKYIGKNLLEKECIIGGEESGGLSIIGHLPEKDGILACLLMVELIAKERTNLQELWANIQKKYGTLVNKRLDIRCTVAEKTRVLEQLKEWRPKTIGDKGVADFITLDGLKLVMVDGNWVLIRPSGTEPLFRIYGEAETNAELQKTLEAVRKELGI